MSSGPQRPLPPKRDVFQALLEGPSVFIHLDPRRQGVVVPVGFQGKPQLVLQVGHNLPVPIPDLAADEHGVSCTLSFNRVPFLCKMPWTAIFALVGPDHRGMVWASDVPPEVAAQMAPPPAPRPAPAPEPPPVAAEPAAKPKRSRKKKGVEGEADTTPPVQAAEKPVKRSRKKKDAPAEAPIAAAPPPAPPPMAAPAAVQQQPRVAVPGGRKPRRELPSYLRVIK